MPKFSSHVMWLPTSLSILLSTLAIIALAQHAFATWSLSAPLALVMAAYNATMQFLLGWAHPYLQAALTWLGSWIGWRPTLYPHWKDVFVVASLLGGGTARIGWHERRPRVVLVLTFPLVFGALISALAAGVLPLQSPDLWTQLLIAMSLGLTTLPHAIIATIMTRYEIDSSIFISLAAAIFLVLLMVVLACIFGNVALWISFAVDYLMGRGFDPTTTSTFPGLGLVGIVVSMVIIGTALTILGLVRRWPIGLRLGITILGGFVGAAFVAAVNAGLKLLGA